MKGMSVDISYYIQDYEIFWAKKIDKEKEKTRDYYLN